MGGFAIASHGAWAQLAGLCEPPVDRASCALVPLPPRSSEKQLLPGPSPARGRPPGWRTLSQPEGQLVGSQRSGHGGGTGVVGGAPAAEELRGGRRGQWEEGQEGQKSLRKRGHTRPGKELGESGMGTLSVLTWMEGVTTPLPDFRMSDIFPFV